VAKASGEATAISISSASGRRQRGIDPASAINIDARGMQNPPRTPSLWRSYPGLFIMVPDLVGGDGLNCGCGV